MNNQLSLSLTFIPVDNETTSYLGLNLTCNDEAIPLSPSAFLLYLYNNEDVLGKENLSFCYGLAKIMKQVKYKQKSCFVLQDAKHIIWLFQQLDQLDLNTSFEFDHEKKPVKIFQKLPFTIRLMQYNSYLRASFVEREECLADSSNWLFFVSGKDSVLCWDEKIIINPNKVALGFLEQFQDQSELVFSFDVAQKFVQSVYNNAKQSLHWKVTGDLDVFLPKQVTPNAFLKLSYDNEQLNLALFYRYGSAPLVSAEDKVLQVYDSKKKTSYDRLPEVEQAFQEFLMECFIQKDIPFILNQPGDIIRFMDEIIPELKERGWKIEKASSMFDIIEETQRTKIEISEKDGWFSFNQEVDVNGQAFSLQEFARLMVENQGYVPLASGAYVKVNEETQQDLEQLVKQDALKHNKFSKAEFLGMLHNTQCLKGQSETVQSTIDSFQQLHQNQSLDFSELKAELRDYQHYGVSWIKYLYDTGFGGILADDMGLGKTIQCLSFLLQLDPTKKHLIVAPSSVIFNWEKEAKKFIPHFNVKLYLGKQRIEELIKSLDDTNILVVSYGILKLDIEYLQGIPFETLILDEGQNIKNPQTQVSKAVKKINARFKLVMTGTPIENHLGDLWNLFDVVMPKFLGTKTIFDLHIKQDGYKTQLKSKIKPFVLRRIKEEVLNSLPEKTEVLLTCPLSPEQQQAYKTVLDAAKTGIKTASGKKDRLNMLTALLKLRQACVDATLIQEFKDTNIPSAKIELAKSKLLEIIDQGHKVVVFSQFKSLLDRLDSWRESQNLYGEYLHGGVAAKERMKRIDRFQTNEEAGVFFVSLKAGGVGINLTAADYVFHLDPWWNPAIESQATDRVHRMGQTNKVMVYKFISEDTIEEKIQLLQQDKRNLLAQLVDIETDTGSSIDYKAIESLILDH